MRMFDRDPRLENEEILDAVRPEPEEPKQLSVAELVLLLQHQDQELLVRALGWKVVGVMPHNNTLYLVTEIANQQ